MNRAEMFDFENVLMAKCRPMDKAVHKLGIRKGDASSLSEFECFRWWDEAVMIIMSEVLDE